MDTQQGMIFGDASESQMSFGMDDGSGLRVVSAKFNSEKKFDWDVFDGFDTLRVLTYSVSVDAIIRMLDKYSFTTFECVFGYEGIYPRHERRSRISEDSGRQYPRAQSWASKTNGTYKFSRKYIRDKPTSES